MRRVIAVTGIVAWLAAALPAQQPTPPQPPPTPDPQAAQSEQPVFRGGVNFVRVDVIVTDRQGNPVSDLKQTDFEVTEDNRPQSVETFRLVKIDTTTPAYTQRSIRTRADEETAAADENARIFVFFLDDYQVRRETSMAARKPLVEFVQTQVSPNDLLGVMYPLTPLDAVVLTRNHEGIARTLAQFEGRKYNYEPKNATEERYVYYPTEVVEQIRRQVSLSALKGLSVKLGAMREGRKAIVLLSEGYSGYVPPQKRDAVASMPGLGNTAYNNPMSTGAGSVAEDRAKFAGDMDVQMELQSVFDAANRTNTSIYSVDPRGLSTGEYDIQDNISQRVSTDQLRATQDTLRVLAENTDGRAIVNRNDLAKGMQQIVRDSSAYYLLGYNSTPAHQDGKFHAIRVRVKRPGVEVRARKGYWALTAEETVRTVSGPKVTTPPAVSRALSSIAPTTGRRLVRTWMGHTQGADGRTKVTFVWEPVPPPPGISREPVQRVALTATSSTGTVLFSGKVPDGDPPTAGRGASLSIDLPPGRVKLRMAVEGGGADSMDTEERDIVVPDLTIPDLKLGTPRVLVARSGRDYQQITADPDAQPVALREFRRADRLLIRINAFGAGADNAAGTARLLNRQGTKMSDLTVAAPTSGQPYLVDLPLSSLPVGEYVIEFSATVEGQQPATELVAFRVTS
jgi:VWFA-related protein